MLVFRQVLIEAFDTAQSQNPKTLLDFEDFFASHSEIGRDKFKSYISSQKPSIQEIKSENHQVCFQAEEEDKYDQWIDINKSESDFDQKPKNFGEKSWIPKNLVDDDPQNATSNKEKEFIKYRLNNPRITKKGDQVVSEGMCNAYFEQRRNVLAQLLQSYKDDDVVIHPLMKKYKPRNYRSKTVGSKYRGVSKNKHKWQVMIMGNFKKFYIGGIKTELDAARLYDKLAIFYHGMEAKTNFKYTKKDVEILIAEPIDSQP